MPEQKMEVRKLKRALHAKAEEVRRNLSKHRASQVMTRQEDPSDEGDLSHQSHEEWLFINRTSIDRQLFRDVNSALQRIEEGSYGTCQRCEEPISPKRLTAIPWAKYCVRCQEEIALAGGEELAPAFRESE
jgi:DnaK suppressor protein